MADDEPQTGEVFRVAKELADETEKQLGAPLPAEARRALARALAVGYDMATETCRNQFQTREDELREVAERAEGKARRRAREVRRLTEQRDIAIRELRSLARRCNYAADKAEDDPRHTPLPPPPPDADDDEG